jgi:predicted alternative tryptophan synthase beta-subunit
MSDESEPVSRTEIIRYEALIRPYVRRTPVIEIDGAEFGVESKKLLLKLELLQHSGLFKARGAFANLLTRKIPAKGVVVASGGNHGAAVAYAAMKLNVPARIFVPTISSPAKLQVSVAMAPIWLSEGIAMPMRSPRARIGRGNPARCAYTRSTRMKPCLDRAQSGWSLTNRRPSSTRFWSPSAAAD